MHDFNITINLLKCIKAKHQTIWRHRIERKINDKWTFQISAKRRLAWAVVGLGDRYAEQITKTWADTTAKTVAHELCLAAGIVLDWQTVDWPLASGKLAVKHKRPIEIIRVLANAVGAIIQIYA